LFARGFLIIATLDHVLLVEISLAAEISCVVELVLGLLLSMNCVSCYQSQNQN